MLSAVSFCCRSFMTTRLFLSPVVVHLHNSLGSRHLRQVLRPPFGIID